MELQEDKTQYIYHFPPTSGDCLDELVSRTGCTTSTKTEEQFSVLLVSLPLLLLVTAFPDYSVKSWGYKCKK